MVMQRVVGIALGYEDLNDHDELRHDPMLAVLAGKLAARRSDCAPLAGKSTLNRLELSRPEPTRYHKVSHDAAAIEACSSICSAKPTRRRRSRSSSIWMPPTIRCMGSRRVGSSTAITTAIATCRSTSSAAATCWLPSCGARTSMPRPVRWRRLPDRGPDPPPLAEDAHSAARRFGLCRDPLMAWCEANRVDYVFGLAGNERLEEAITAELITATIESLRTGKPARCFTDFSYATLDSWSRNAGSSARPR